MVRKGKLFGDTVAKVQEGCEFAAGRCPKPECIDANLLFKEQLGPMSIFNYIPEMRRFIRSPNPLISEVTPLAPSVESDQQQSRTCLFLKVARTPSLFWVLGHLSGHLSYISHAFGGSRLCGPP